MTRYSELVVREALYSLPVTADYDQARPAESYGSHTAVFLWDEDSEAIGVDRPRLQ